MVSLAASGRLQNATKYCTKVHKTTAAGKESNNSASIEPSIIKFYMDSHVNLFYSHTGYDVNRYFRSTLGRI